MGWHFAGVAPATATFTGAPEEISVAREGLAGQNDDVIHPQLQEGVCMLNFDRGNRPGNTPANPKDAPKPGLKPALYEPPVNPASSAAGSAARPASSPLGTSPTTTPPRDALSQTPSAPSAAPAASTTAGITTESKLHVGVNIKLKGVEISDCDGLVIEGHVEATVHSKAMEIAEPGTLKGTALIDVAEIRGEFTGELTARTRLVVHGTGRVSGNIRYGKLVVEEGGEISGDLQRISEGNAQAKPAAPAPSTELRMGLSPQPAHNTN
jgi:cytoskeletal protein CcmA (bactofilin family)